MDGLLSLLLFAGLFFLMMRFGCGSHVGHGGHGHRHGGHGAAEEGPMYTCPMHPEIRQTYPGSCPKCGMQLAPESTSKGGQPS
ncbi:heavy metal-binding domain-containing protein [Sideroxyarcus sp. TK5]